MEEEKREQVKEYLLNNTATLKEVVNELNSWDGSLEDLRVEENNEEFFNVYFKTPMEAVRATYFGEYNYSDDLVRFNAYGNLDSCSEWEYEEELQNSIDEIIDCLEENINNITIWDDELKNIIESEVENDELERD